MLCIFVVDIFREVILKDELHRTSNKCLMCYVIVLWPSSGMCYLRMYYIECQTNVSYSMELYCGHFQGGDIEGCIT